MEAEAGRFLLDGFAGGATSSGAGHAEFQDASGKGAGVDLLGAAQHSLRISRRKARFYAASASSSVGQPLRRLQGSKSAPGGHASRSGH